MTFLDKTFCQSPNCKNECGRKMTDAEKYHLSCINITFPGGALVSYGYFCGEPDTLNEELSPINPP